MLKKELTPKDLLAVVDTREQLPCDLSPMRMVRATLATGDYSIAGLTGLVSVERKSKMDYISCVAGQRERFDRVCERLAKFEHKAIVVEASWDELYSGDWRGATTPKMVYAATVAWQTMGIPIYAAGSPQGAATYISDFLYRVGCRRWRELVGFFDFHAPGMAKGKSRPTS